MIWSATCLWASMPAVSSDSLLAVMRSCEAQTDESVRLKCYDRGVAQFKGADDGAGNVTCSEHTGTDQFGLSSAAVLHKKSNGERAPKQITARIVTLAHRAGAGEALIVHLDNGQVWEQTEDGPDLHIVAGDAVAIDRGLLGAYWLSPVSGRLAVKVRRTQ